MAPKYATADRAAYGAEGGYAGLRLSAGVSRYFGPFYVGLFARYINLDGATFEDSPLVGSNNTFVGGVAIGWILMKSDEMVPVGAEANLRARGHVPTAEARDPKPTSRKPANPPSRRGPSAEAR